MISEPSGPKNSPWYPNPVDQKIRHYITTKWTKTIRLEICTQWTKNVVKISEPSGPNMSPWYPNPVDQSSTWDVGGAHRGNASGQSRSNTRLYRLGCSAPTASANIDDIMAFCKHSGHFSLGTSLERRGILYLIWKWVLKKSHQLKELFWLLCLVSFLSYIFLFIFQLYVLATCLDSVTNFVTFYVSSRLKTGSDYRSQNVGKHVNLIYWWQMSEIVSK